MNERIVALDVGDRRIGIAVSDALGITAQPIETYTRVGYGPDVRRSNMRPTAFSAACRSTWMVHRDFRQKRSRSWPRSWKKRGLSFRITTSG